MPQFSLRTLLGVVAIAAIGVSGLTHPTRYWKFAVVSLALAITWLVSLHAISSRARSQTFFIGFAVSAWAYFLLLVNRAEYSLVTTWSLEWLYPFTHAGPDPNMTHYGIFFVGPNGFPYLTAYSNYLHIGHALWMLAIGYFGGLAVQRFSAGDAKKRVETPRHETSSEGKD